MPRRSLSQSSFFAPEFVMPDCLEPGTTPWLLAKYRSTLYPSWLFAGWKGEGRRGRKAWPAVTLMTLLVLRWSEEGMSRLGSTKRARWDVQWRAAMGLNCEIQVPDEKTLREFEAFLQQRHPACDIPRYMLLHEHIVRLCIKNGVVKKGAMWAMDSTPMWCYGAVLDTVRLLGDGTRMLAIQWAKAIGSDLEQVAEQWRLPFLLAKSTKGFFPINWKDRQDRGEVVKTLAQGVMDAVKVVKRHIDLAPKKRRKRLLRRCARLLRVIQQDLETDDEGALVVARRVAKDRLISMTDPQARHGHKSQTRQFNGFKVHLLGELCSGLIASLTVTQGNRFDGKVGHRLIRRAKALEESISMVLGDTAYGGAELRYMASNLCNVSLVAPPPSFRPPPPGRLDREAIQIDFDARTATCAAGVCTDDCVWLWSEKYQHYTFKFRWSVETCRSCHLRQACMGKAIRGHRLLLNPFEQQMRQARKDWQEPDVRETYRKRSQCERLVNQMTRHGARRARAWGLRAAHLQAHLIAMRCNLALLARTLAENLET